MNIQSSKEQEKPILYFDSGIGGIPYAVKAMQALPHERFVYLADRAGFPYGTKERGEVTEFVFKAIDTASTTLKPKAVVVACNTATEIAIHALRVRHPDLPFIGTVPAIKPAAEQTQNGRIAVIATNRAISEPYLDKLVEQHAGNVKLLKIGASPLVSWIERSLLTSDPQERIEVLESYIKEVRDFGADMLVLGCTHFLHLYKDFVTVAKPDITIIDSRNGITKQLCTVLETMKLSRTAQNNDSTSGVHLPPKLQCTFWVTGQEPIEDRYKYFAEQYGFAFRGILS